MQRALSTALFCLSCSVDLCGICKASCLFQGFKFLFLPHPLSRQLALAGFLAGVDHVSDVLNAIESGNVRVAFLFRLRWGGSRSTESPFIILCGFWPFCSFLLELKLGAKPRLLLNNLKRTAAKSKLASQSTFRE